MALSHHCCWVIVVVALLPFTAHSLDENSVKELKCLKTETDPKLDWQWVHGVDRWYFPMWSALSIYRTSSDIMELEVSSIPSDMLSYMCLTYSESYDFAAYNKTGVKIHTEMMEDNRIRYVGQNSPFGVWGTQTIVHSDNKNFMIGVNCYDDDQAGWMIWSTTPILSQTRKKLATGILENLGFNMKHATKVPYDGKFCIPASDKKWELFMFMK